MTFRVSWRRYRSCTALLTTATALLVALLAGLGAGGTAQAATVDTNASYVLVRSTHTVRLVKRNDTQWGTSTFRGFIGAPGGAVLSKPAACSRQIEFIGDSLTVGYGNLSTSRTCPWDQVKRTTNTDVSYGALTARRLNADYQINGYSGLGMVRNYNGGSPASRTGPSTTVPC